MTSPASEWRDVGLTIRGDDVHVITLRRHDDGTVIKLYGDAEFVFRLSKTICDALNADEEERKRVGNIDPSTVMV